jgi:predicted CoA-binding protein
MTSIRTDDSAEWRDHLLESSDQIRDLLRRIKRIAVLGIKTEAQSFQPAYYVPEFVQEAGYEIVPVPVYYPEATSILGQQIYRRVADIPGDVDMVNVFRRSQDVPPHVDDILTKRPKAVWMQSGIRHDEVAERLARAGIDVVQDRCLMVEVRRLGR